jgi:hypothetical protein
VLAALLFGITGVIAFTLPRIQVASQPTDQTETDELRGAGVRFAATGMAFLRAAVGFLTLLLAFDLREGAPKWQFGVVAGFSVLGALIGSATAPKLRSFANEETLLSGMLVLTTAAAIGGFLLDGWQGASLLGAAVGIAATAGRAAFDSIVQRDAPDANYGRSFARFETRFQLSWVIGAFVPVAIEMTLRVGFLLVAVVSGFAAFSYIVGSTAARHRHEAEEEGGDPTTSRAVHIDDRMSQASAEVTGRVTDAAKSVKRRFKR